MTNTVFCRITIFTINYLSLPHALQAYNASVPQILPTTDLTDFTNSLIILPISHAQRLSLFTRISNFIQFSWLRYPYKPVKTQFVCVSGC